MGEKHLSLVREILATAGEAFSRITPKREWNAKKFKPLQHPLDFKGNLC